MNTATNLPPDSEAKDPFFVLRDCRELFQQRLVEAVRESGIDSPAALRAFTKAIGESYDELVAAKQRGGFDQTHGLTASRITLMCDSDLELEIRIGEITRRLAAAGGNDLWRVHLRYMTLLRRTDLAPSENPVGPETIGPGLWAVCKADNVGVEGSIERLAVLEEQLLQRLPGIYAELNELLASRKVELAQTQIVSAGGTRPTGPRAASGGANGAADPFAALQELLNRQTGSTVAGGGDGGGVGVGGVGGGGSGLATGFAGGAGDNMALGAATLVMLRQLAERLDQLELSGAGSSAGGAAPADAEVPPPRTLKSTDLGVALGQPEAVALDTLSLIFEAIFETWELPDTVKTAIGRLQIPLLKLALFDATLFSDVSHPARRLIDGMARAAVGLPRDIGRAHPVSMRLWQLAGTVAEKLHGDSAVLDAPLAILDAPLADLDALIADRDRDVIAAAQPYISLLKDKERRDQAALAARRWLRAIEEQGVAPAILDFLQHHWLRVMEAACLEGGEAGHAWQRDHATIADLLWSTQPKQSPEERKSLAGMLPHLLQRINDGLDRIDEPAEARAPFFDAFFTLQTAALHGATAVPPPPAPAPPPTGTVTATDIVVDILDIDGRLLKTLSLADPSAAAWRGPDAPVQAGSWLQFTMADGETLCGLACWLSPQFGGVLLFNPDWGYAVAIAPAVIEQQLREARAKIESSRSVFDTAADRALTRLRDA